MLDELLSLALVGTAHSGAAASLPEGLEDAAKSIADPTPEQRLLTHAILLDAYCRAGIKPTAGAAPVTGAASDTLTACSLRAADLLGDFIRENSKELIAQWLAAAAKSGQRVPHRLLADLLELARKDRSLRSAVVAVIDQRGRWLMSQNTDWQFAVAADDLDESFWETGTPEQRQIVLRQVRNTEPSRARDLLQKTWKDDPADQRAEFLKLFIAGLSSADESLLESMLDDRSKQVRAVAADLLSRLPQSQLVQRMIARVSPLITFKRGLLKGAKLEVILPEALDKATLRDGIEKAAPQGTGEKQWWLQQLISFVPLSVWTETSGLKPTDIITAVAKNDFANVVLQGFTLAAERHLDSNWIDPLLRHGFEETGRLNRTLLAALPAQQFLGLAIDLLRHKRLGLVACSDLINNHNVALDLATGRLWAQKVADLSGSRTRDDWTILYHLPMQCAMRLPPALRQEIELLWSVAKEPWMQFRSSVEKLLKVLEVRQQVEKEFPK